MQIDLSHTSIRKAALYPNASIAEVCEDLVLHMLPASVVRSHTTKTIVQIKSQKVT